MATNEERREVAQRFRGIDYDSLKESLICAFLDAVGEPGYLNWVEIAHRLADLIEPEQVTGETSDGYHTFNELYDHRAKLFSVIVSAFYDRAWKSKKHNDGTMYDGMFIVGIDTPNGQATYHYDIDPYWDMFKCREVNEAPEWDGHTSEQAIDRIHGLSDIIEPKPGRTCKPVCVDREDQNGRMHHLFHRCSECGHDLPYEAELGHCNFCPNCGAKVVY